MYGVLGNGTWSIVKVRSGPPSGRTSIAFDGEGSPCICYGLASYVTPMALPTFVMFGYVESEKVDLYWSYPAEVGPEDIGEFVIYKGLEPGNLTPLVSLAGTQTSYEDRSVVGI